jgi:phosphoribosylformylglycinamidine synthase
MLMVLKPGREAEAEAIFRKWELDFAVIGRVTDTGHMVLTWNGEVAADIPLAPLADEAPLYDRPYLSRDEYKVWAQVKPLGDVPESTDIAADLLKLMASPDIASRRWIYEQYDQKVGGDTVQAPGGDAAVVRVHGTEKALAITTDCTPRYCYADPYEGGKQAIAEAYRNLCAVGALPLAVTNCLNFANPQRPEIMAQIVHCLEGMSEACLALDFPIVSGNVSLYNESKATGGGSAILPTPAIGGVGLMEDWTKAASIGFKATGEAILLVGSVRNADSDQAIGQSLWLREIHGREDGPPPSVDLEKERLCGELVRELIAAGRVSAVHDLADGGLAVALSEMALAGNVGAAVQTDAFLHRLSEDLFGEAQGRYLLAVPQQQPHETAPYDAMAHFQDRGIGCDWIGNTIDEPLVRFIISRERKPWLDQVDIPLADLRAAHEGFFPKLMNASLTAS